MEDILTGRCDLTAHMECRGEVKVFPTTDDVNRFKKLKQVILDTGKETDAVRNSECKIF